MSFYEIGGAKVFITHERHRLLHVTALAQKDPMFRALSLISPEKAAEAGKLCHNYLTRLAQDDPGVFLRDWVLFDLREQEARKNITSLLSDYCLLTRLAALKSEMSDVGGLMFGFAGAGYEYPLGPRFRMVLNTRQPLWPLRGRPMRAGAEIAIEVSDVVRAWGTVTDFCLQLSRFSMHCGPSGLEIPGPAPVEEEECDQ